MYDGLNVGKRNVTFNLKQPDAVELVRRLIVEWADAVAENFAPRAMTGFGLDYDVAGRDQARSRHGQRVPQRPDRSAPRLPRLRRPGLRARRATTSSPVGPTASRSGPYGTITDSLAPRFVATALAAGLHYRRRTGRGVYLDVSQVEAAIYSLSPWLLDYQRTGHARDRAPATRAIARILTACSRVPTRRWTARSSAIVGSPSPRGRRPSMTASWRSPPATRLRTRHGPHPARGGRDAASRGDRGGAGGGLRRRPLGSAGRAPRPLRAR